MSDKPAPQSNRNLGLMGTLKIAAGLIVILLAGLAILWVMDMITSNQFIEYMLTLLTVVVIGSMAGAVIALMIRPGK